MNKIISLTKVFAKEYYQNFSIFNSEKKKVNKKSILFWLMVIVFLGMAYISYEIIIFLKEVGQAEMFLNLYFFILAIFLLFQSILMSTNIFFFSKDLENVLYMPIKPTELLLAKFNTMLTILYVTEGILGLVPLTLYGLLTQVPFLFYFWEIIILAIFPVFFALLVSIFVLLIMRLVKFMRSKEVFQVLMTIVLMVVFISLEFIVINRLFQMQSDGQSLQQITTFSEKSQTIGKNFFVINPSISILANPTNIRTVLISFFKLISYNGIASVIFLIIGKVTYIKDILRSMVSKTKFSEKKRKTEYSIKKNSVRKAYILKELKMLWKEPAFFMQCIFPVVIILITGVIGVIAILPILTEIMKEETIRKELQNISLNIEMVCYLLIALQVLFSISNISLTAVSREGKSAVFMKQIPISFYQQFQYKSVPQILVNSFVSLIVLAIVGYIIPLFDTISLIMIFAISMLINGINSYLMLIVDLRRPNLNWDTVYSVVKKSSNKFFQYAFMIINVLFLMYVAKWLEGIDLKVALLAEMMIFAVIFFTIDRCVKKWQSKLFNKII